MWRKMSGTRRIDNKTYDNETVLDEVNERRMNDGHNDEKKNKLVGRLLRQNEFIAVVMEGKINDKRTGGRPRESIVEEVFHRTGFTSRADNIRGRRVTDMNGYNRGVFRNVK